MIISRTLAYALVLGSLSEPVQAQAREAVLVTFPRAPDSGLVDGVARSGLEIGEFVEGETYLGSVAPGALEDARGSLPAGVTIVPVPAEQKLITLGPPADADDAGLLTVEIIPAVGAGDTAIAAALGELPVTVLDANQRQGWIVEIDPAYLQALARSPMVESLYAAPQSGTLK